MKRVTLNKWATGCALMLAAAACGPVEDESVEAPASQAEQSVTARLSGTVLDWNDQAVANADVQLMLNGKAHGEPTLTDADGRYTLNVDVAAIQEATRMRQEVTLSVYSPYEDRGAEATFEGDRIRLLPLTLREFIDMDALQDGADVNVRTAYVPLQAKGYKITPELIANGGELAWKVPNPMGEGEDIEVTLIVEPNSIKVDGEDPQDEITLTVLDAERAPMQIPNDGFGVMWTIQPRDVRFDPPARIRMVGDRLSVIGLTDVQAGAPFDLFGATLDRGWQRYGDVQIANLTDNTITLESTTGVIPKGAWGHVLSNPDSDAGMLVTCLSERGTPEAPELVPVRCAILGFGSVAGTQKDYRDQSRDYYYTDRELVCGGCTNNGHPESQMATGLTTNGGADEYVFAVVVELCADEVGLSNEDRDLSLNARFTDVVTFIGTGGGVDEGAGAGSTPQTQLWESFCSDSEACPEYTADEVPLERRRFSKQHAFITSPQRCILRGQGAQ